MERVEDQNYSCRSIPSLLTQADLVFPAFPLPLPLKGHQCCDQKGLEQPLSGSEVGGREEGHFNVSCGPSPFQVF